MNDVGHLLDQVEKGQVMMEFQFYHDYFLECLVLLLQKMHFQFYHDYTRPFVAV